VKRDYLPGTLDTSLRLFRISAGRYVGAAYEYWAPVAEFDDVDDVLLAHPERLSVYHLRRSALLLPAWHIRLLEATTPERTPLRNWKLAEVLAWLGQLEQAADILAEEVARTAGDSVEGPGPHQRHRGAALARLLHLYVQLEKMSEARAVFEATQRFLADWYAAWEEGAAPPPDRYAYIVAGMTTGSLVLPDTVTIDPRDCEVVERNVRAEWNQLAQQGAAFFGAPKHAASGLARHLQGLLLGA
jgi:hypothetical protein